MRRTHIGSVLVALLGLPGCGGALPDVANAYGDQFGAVETSPIADCPTIEGVDPGTTEQQVLPTCPICRLDLYCRKMANWSRTSAGLRRTCLASRPMHGPTSRLNRDHWKQCSTSPTGFLVLVPRRRRRGTRHWTTRRHPALDTVGGGLPPATTH